MPILVRENYFGSEHCPDQRLHGSKIIQLDPPQHPMLCEIICLVFIVGSLVAKEFFESIHGAGNLIDELMHIHSA